MLFYCKTTNPMRRSPPRPCSGPPSLIPPFITASLLFPPLRCPFLSSWTTGKTGWEIGCLKPSIPKSWSCKPLYYFFDLPVCLSSFLFIFLSRRTEATPIPQHGEVLSLEPIDEIQNQHICVHTASQSQPQQMSCYPRDIFQGVFLFLRQT